MRSIDEKENKGDGFVFKNEMFGLWKETKIHSTWNLNHLEYRSESENAFGKSQIFNSKKQNWPKNERRRRIIKNEKKKQETFNIM